MDSVLRPPTPLRDKLGLRIIPAGMPELSGEGIEKLRMETSQHSAYPELLLFPPEMK